MEVERVEDGGLRGGHLAPHQHEEGGCRAPGPGRQIQMKPCSIPMARLKGHSSPRGTGRSPKVYQEKISRLESRVSSLEEELLLVRRQVRIIQMDSTETVRRTVLQLLNNQTFSISTSFEGTF